MTVPPKSALQYLGPIGNILKGPGYSSIDPNLVVAIIWQESGGNTWAYNPEPRYRWFWDVKKDEPFRALTDAEIASKVPPADFQCFAGDRDQEWWAQQASWGLMQLMGACGRQGNFRGGFLTELCDPYINLEFGIKHLWQYAFQFGGRSKIEALNRWNGGGNSNYANEVLEKVKAVEESL